MLIRIAATLMDLIGGLWGIVARHCFFLLRGGCLHHHLLARFLDHFLRCVENLVACCGILAVSRDLLLFVVILNVLH